MTFSDFDDKRRDVILFFRRISVGLNTLVWFGIKVLKRYGLTERPNSAGKTYQERTYFYGQSRPVSKGAGPSANKFSCFIYLCLAFAIALRRKLAASIARATVFGPAVAAGHRPTTPQSATLGLHPLIWISTHLPTHEGWMAELAMLADR